MSDQILAAVEGLQNTTLRPERTVFKKLKRETEPIHKQLEDGLALLDSAIDVSSYRRLLERFYGFYVPWEHAVYRSVCQLLPGRSKVAWLTRDLRTLGSDCESLSLCPYVPAASNPASAFGSMYVIEGSTLGGQLIVRHLEKVLSLPPVHSFNFFRGYGSETGRNWKNFQSAVLANTGQDQDDAVVQSALITFEALQRWLLSNEAKSV